MLSRAADSIYWLARYVERAENVARFVHVTLRLMLDSPEMSRLQWEPLVKTTGDEEDFKERYGEANQEDVIQFLTFDRQNPNSILSCLRAARENARSVREIISSEMWLQVNKFYLFVNSFAHGLESPEDFYTEVKLQSHLFAGVTDATMTHGEAWNFGQLGRALERADKTSRLLDVKYFMLLRSVADVGTAFDDVQWAAVLRSASAFEMYRKRHGRISPKGVANFLILDREFPRAVHTCLLGARDSLHAITGTPVGRFTVPPERMLGQLCSDLSYASIDEIIGAGLHEYLDDLQTRLNDVGTGIFDCFFAFKSPPAGVLASPRQAQRQTQSAS